MKMTLTALFLTLVVACPVATADHSKAAFYELDTISEVEGAVTRVLWRNAHIRFWLETTASKPPGKSNRRPPVFLSGTVLGRMYWSSARLSG